MASFLNMNGGAPQATDSFNYDTEADILKRRRALALALGKTDMPKGGVTNAGGFFAGGSTGLDVLASALRGYLSGDQLYKADQAEKDLDARSAAAQKSALMDYLAPSSVPDAVNNAYAVTYKNPEDVGPPRSAMMNDGAQASPVQQSQVRGTALPPAQGGPLQAAIAAQQAQNPNKPTAQQIERAVQGDAPPGMVIDGAVMPMPQAQPNLPASVTTPYTGPQFQGNGATGSWDTAPAAPTAPAQNQAPVQAPPLAQAVAAQQAQAPQKTFNPQDTFNVNQGVLDDAIAAAKAQDAARKADARGRLYNSGPQGKAYIEGLDKFTNAVELAKASKEAAGPWKRGEDGVLYNQFTGQEIAPAGGVTQKQQNWNAEQQVKKQDQAFKIMETRDKQQAAYDTHTNTIANLDNAIKLNSTYAPYGGAISQIYGAVASKLGNDKANEFNNAMKQLELQIAQANSGQGAWSNSEREILREASASMANGKMPNERALNLLRQAEVRKQQSAQSSINGFNNMLKANGFNPDGTPLDQSAPAASQPRSKSGLDWMPAR